MFVGEDKLNVEKLKFHKKINQTWSSTHVPHTDYGLRTTLILNIKILKHSSPCPPLAVWRKKKKIHKNVCVISIQVLGNLALLRVPADVSLFCLCYRMSHLWPASFWDGSVVHLFGADHSTGNSPQSNNLGLPGHVIRDHSVCTVIMSIFGNYNFILPFRM